MVMKPRRGFATTGGNYSFPRKNSQTKRSSFAVGSIAELSAEHDGSPRKNARSRNSRIAVKYNPNLVREKQRNGQWRSALMHINISAPETSPVTYTSIVRLCRNSNALLEGMVVHAYIIINGQDVDVPLSNRLIQMYGASGCFEDARGLFDRIVQRDVVSWTSMIATYTNYGQDDNALLLFRQMLSAGVKANRVTFLCILPVCARQTTIDVAKEVHTAIKNRDLETDIVVGTELVNMYGKFGSLKDAREMFDKMPERNVISWNAMISSYAQHGKFKEALRLFQEMLQDGIQPSNVSFVSSLHASANQQALAQGKWMHAYLKDLGFEHDISVGTALINMYGKCDSLDEAYEVFRCIIYRDVVMWTSLITAYSQQGKGKEALSVFGIMDQEGVLPNEVTLVSVLDACTNQVALVHGKKIHTYLISFRLDSDLVTGNALINMYGKCGDLVNAQKVFERILNKNSISWSSLIGAYSQHGKAKAVVQLFERMRSEGVVPDEITFSSVLSACSYAGLVDEGRRYFESMEKEYEIEPTILHFNRMLDILGRAGLLEECKKLILSMPMPATAATWMTFLGACKMHADEEYGEMAASHVFKLEPNYAAPYVLLSNIYASNGRWKDAEQIRNKMNEKGIELPMDASLALDHDADCGLEFNDNAVRDLNC